MPLYQELLTRGTFNPQLLQFEKFFKLSAYAFVVQCSNSHAALLLKRNPLSTRLEYADLEVLEELDENDAERETPCNDILPTAWLFPEWGPQKTLYIFGTLQSCDIVLPLAAYVSRKHLAVYLNENGVWMARNLSRYGTWINHDFLGISVPGEPDTLTCFHPDESNIVRFGNVELRVHPILHPPPNLRNEQAVSLLLQDFDIQSDGTRTASVTEASTVYRPTYATPETYLHIPTTNVTVQGDSEVSKVIHKVTGQCFLAKSYGPDKESRALDQFEMMASIQNHPNIVGYFDYVDNDTGSKIITSYLEALPLCEYLGVQGRIHDIEMAFVIYRQMTDALAWLKDRAVAHNDINTRTILVELKNGRYTSYLTGFSEHTLVNPAETELFKCDLSSLTHTIDKMLPTLDGAPCCDPDLRTLMLRTHENQITAEELGAALNSLAPNFERSYFQGAPFTREMSIKRVVDDDGTEAIRLLDFLRIILHQSARYLKEAELAVRKVIRIEHLFQLEGETYCSLHDAEKLLHHLHRENYTRLLDLTPPKHSKARFYRTTHEISIGVSYHDPTGMVNITQILNLFDTEVVEEALRRFDTSSLREIRGSPQWSGYYVRRSSLAELFSQLSLPRITYSWENSKETCPIDQFFGGSDTVSIATDEMIGLIVYSREDEVISWGSRALTVEEAVKSCEEHGLPVARTTLSQITADSSHSSIHYSDDDIMRLFNLSDESDYPTEATSHTSFLSQDTIRFQPRKKKQKGKAMSDIPRLPVQRKLRAREISTPVKKVEEWVAAGPDIRSTRFISSKKGDASKRR